MFSFFDNTTYTPLSFRIAGNSLVYMAEWGVVYAVLLVFRERYASPYGLLRCSDFLGGAGIFDGRGPVLSYVARDTAGIEQEIDLVIQELEQQFGVCLSCVFGVSPSGRQSLTYIGSLAEQNNGDRATEREGDGERKGERDAWMFFP